MKVNYTQITRTRPWRHFEVVKFDSWSFGVRVWRRGWSIRAFGRTLMFESRDPWDYPDDLAADSWGIGCKRAWRRGTQ